MVNHFYDTLSVSSLALVIIEVKIHAAVPYCAKEKAKLKDEYLFNQ